MKECSFGHETEKVLAKAIEEDEGLEPMRQNNQSSKGLNGYETRAKA